MENKVTQAMHRRVLANKGGMWGEWVAVCCLWEWTRIVEVVEVMVGSQAMKGGAEINSRCGRAVG